ncbi:hypothetical protein PIN31115_00043 [Pandoraea iniqua]|uniref:Uncharacterized protein n=1 Tax=Pandoraea iniqua TaxID=2508288 RepID=A0A5E4RB13_9BURK|nr:hypothetical protein [Pandoraea iniqua]VVD59973.1 hypothetical protein PIN31115_00043 [Pandoraea iniqua]
MTLRTTPISAAAPVQADDVIDGERLRVPASLKDRPDGLALLRMLHKLFVTMRTEERNVDQSFRTRHDVIVFERAQTARQEKYSANKKHYSSGMSSAGGGLGAGLFSLVGGAGGAAAGFKGMGDIARIGSDITNGMGTTIKHGIDFKANNESFAGRDNDVLGEFETSLTDETRRTNDRLRQRIEASSADIREKSQAMLSMWGQQVVKMYESIR